MSLAPRPDVEEEIPPDETILLQLREGPIGNHEIVDEMLIRYAQLDHYVSAWNALYYTCRPAGANSDWCHPVTGRPLVSPRFVYIREKHLGTDGAPKQETSPCTYVRSDDAPSTTGLSLPGPKTTQHLADEAEEPREFWISGIKFIRTPLKGGGYLWQRVNHANEPIGLGRVAHREGTTPPSDLAAPSTRNTYSPFSGSRYGPPRSLPITTPKEPEPEPVYFIVTDLPPEPTPAPTKEATP